MNMLADAFERLVVIVRTNPESQDADTCAADLAAKLAQLPEHFACVALVHPQNVERYRGYALTVYVLEPYGVTLSRRRRSTGGMLVFAKLIQPAPSPLAGAVVLEQPGLESDVPDVSDVLVFKAAA